MGKINHSQLVNIDELYLDTDNPRIKKFMEMYGNNPSAEQMALALGAGSYDSEVGDTPTFESLKQSILTNGGIFQPIIVNKDALGKMTVVEGNTRLSIYKEFKANGARGDWEKIPAIVNENLNKHDIDAIRLQAHLVGPRPWDPYSKAKYLYSLRNDDNLPMSQIVDFCGGKKKEILEYIEAYRDIETYYRPILSSDGDFDSTRFSGFVELQKSGVKKAIFDAGFTLTDFAKWIDTRKIDPLNTVRSIPNILSNPKAKEVFLKEGGGAKEAKKILDIPPPPTLKELPLEVLLNAALSKINQIQYSEIKKLRSNINEQSTQTIFDLRDALVDLSNDINEEG